MKLFIVLAAVLGLAAGPVLADSGWKDGSYTPWNPGEINVPSELRTDWEYNTGGYIDCVPTLGGSWDGWGSFFITVLYNDTGNDLCLGEFGFPCGGPPVSWGWVVWTDLPNMNPPPGDGYSADFHGGFTPTDPDPNSFPPTTYTYIDVSGQGIIIEAGTYWAFGYENPGMGGQVDYNGVATYAWYGGYWDPDPSWGRTAVLQVKADFGPSPTEETTWGSIKQLCR